MAISQQNSILNPWNFGTIKEPLVFPSSYNSYEKLFPSDTNHYSQDNRNNLINLQYTFDTVMQNKGLGNVIIDVNSSAAKGELVKAKKSTGNNEVVLRSKIKNGTTLVGLFRGSCDTGAKRGLFNFSVFVDKNMQCNPTQETYQQVVFFPNTYFTEFYRDKGIVATSVSKVLSGYSGDNPFYYLFYFGPLVVNGEGTIYRYGHGKMFRIIPYGGFETIEGTWGGGYTIETPSYSSDFVADAVACRFSNSGSDIIEGIAIGGLWYKGTYFGGNCLSWRINFGSGVVFNYTGLLHGRGRQPVAGVGEFYKINYREQKDKVSDSFIDTTNLESFFIRSFMEDNESETSEKKDTIKGTWVKYTNGKVSSIYFGEFDGNSFTESGYGIKIFLGEQVTYIYIGNFARLRHKLGTMYTIRGVRGAEGDCNDIEFVRGRFGINEITEDSKLVGDDFYRESRGTADKEEDKSNALLQSREAVKCFYAVVGKCRNIFNTVIGNVRQMETSINSMTQPQNMLDCIKNELAKLEQGEGYRQQMESSFKLTTDTIEKINRCNSNSLRVETATPMGTTGTTGAMWTALSPTFPGFTNTSSTSSVGNLSPSLSNISGQSPMTTFGQSPAQSPTQSPTQSPVGSSINTPRTSSYFTRLVTGRPPPNASFHKPPDSGQLSNSSQETNITPLPTTPFSRADSPVQGSPMWSPQPGFTLGLGQQQMGFAPSIPQFTGSQVSAADSSAQNLKLSLKNQNLKERLYIATAELQKQQQQQAQQQAQHQSEQQQRQIQQQIQEQQSAIQELKAQLQKSLSPQVQPLTQPTTSSSTPFWSAQPTTNFGSLFSAPLQPIQQQPFQAPQQPVQAPQLVSETQQQQPVQEPQQQQVQAPQQQLSSALQQQQQKVQSQAKKEIFVWSCKRYLPDSHLSMWEDGYIALSEYYLGYGKGNNDESKQKAIYRAKEGHDAKNQEFVYYYAYPVEKCEAILHSPANITSFSMMVTYSHLPVPPNTRQQIFAFEKLEVRDAFIARINDYSKTVKAELDDYYSKNPDEKKKSDAAVATAAKGAPVTASPTPVPSPVPPPVPPGLSPPVYKKKQEKKEIKEILQKKLNDVLYYKDTLLQLQSYKNLSKDIKNIFDSPLFKDWVTRYAFIKDKLTSIISRLDANDSTSVPTDAELTKDITDVRELLSTADIFKTQIIDVIEKLDESVDSADVPLIKVAKLLVKRIKEHDEEYKKMSVDSTTTEMVTVVEDAKKVLEEAKGVFYLFGNLTNFYDSTTGVVDSKIKQVATYYTEMTNIVERIDTCRKSAGEILTRVSVFDKVARSAAESSVSTVEKIKIDIYIAATQGLATLVTNIYDAAAAAYDVAITASNAVKPTTILTVTEDQFKILKETFDKAVAAGDTIYVNSFDTRVYYSTSKKYLAAAVEMVNGIKGKKSAASTGHDVVSLLKQANEAVNLCDDKGKILSAKNSEITVLKERIKELQTELEAVNKEYDEIKALREKAASVNAELEKASQEGIVLFNKYHSLTSSSGSGSTSDEIAATMAAANKTVLHINEFNESIDKLFSEAISKVNNIITKAKFEFIKNNAETKLTELQDYKKDVDAAKITKVQALQDKRKDVYKISNIVLIEEKSVELTTKYKSIEELHKKTIYNLRSVVTKKGTVLELIEQQKTSLGNNDTHENITKLKDEIGSLNTAGNNNKLEADTALLGLKDIKDSILKLYAELEKNKTVEFSNSGEKLKIIVHDASSYFEKATVFKKTIDSEAKVLEDTNADITKIVMFYSQIYHAFIGAFNSVNALGIDEKIKQQELVDKKFSDHVDALIEDANSALTSIEDIIKQYDTTGSVVSKNDMDTVDRQYEKVEKIIDEITKKITEYQSMRRDFLNTVGNVLTSLTDTISAVNGIKSNATTYQNLTQYADAVHTELVKVEKNIRDKRGSVSDVCEELIRDNNAKKDILLASSEKIKQEVGKLKVSHKTHTCNTVGSEFTFSSKKLSGKDDKITISGDGKTATQTHMSVNCLWLTTEKGIPTDCDNAVTWAIKISTSDVKNLPEMLMGVGLDKFNPFEKGSGSGVQDCKVVAGFWGLSQANTYINGNEYNESTSLKNNDIVFFTLSPVAVAVSSSSSETVTSNAFILNMFCNNLHKKIELNVPDGTNNLYPIVRFKSNGDKYIFMDVNSNLKLLKTSGNFSAATLKDAGFTVAALKDAGFTDLELQTVGFTAHALNAVKVARGVSIPSLPPPRLSAAAQNAAEEAAAAQKAAEEDAAAQKAAEEAAAAQKAAEEDAAAAQVAADAQAAADARIEKAKNLLSTFNLGVLPAFTLENRGITAKEAKEAGFNAAQLKEENFTAIELKDAGFSLLEMKDARFTASDLKGAGYTASELMHAAFTLEELKDAGFTASDLKGADYTAIQLKSVGFSATELRDANFTAEQLRDAGFPDQELIAAHIISKPGILSRFKKIFSGGKSGSITRKRRLRLKKSRSVTRHKGGKKSVRFSARVKLNNGKGNGKGKGSSSMNKRTRKMLSNSYKLSARPIVKLKP